MLDNMTVDGNGNLSCRRTQATRNISRASGNSIRANASSSKSRNTTRRAFGSRNRKIITPPTPPFNSDEESSRVIEITHLFRKNSQSSDLGRFDRHDDDEFDERFKWTKRGYRFYLGVTQAHYSAGDSELVEGGQLYIIEGAEELSLVACRTSK